MQSLGNLARNKPTTGAACCPEYGGKKEENYESFIWENYTCKRLGAFGM